MRGASRWLAARGILRELLSAYLGLPARDLPIEERRDAAPRTEGLSFGLSHSRGILLVAVTAGRRVGVDLEWVRPLDPERLGRRILTPAELAALERLPAERRLEAVFAAWTRKEACLKAIGSGVPGGFRSVEAGVDPVRPGRLAGWAGSGDGDWALEDLHVEPGYRAAVAGDHAPFAIVLRRLELAAP